MRLRPRRHAVPLLAASLLAASPAAAHHRQTPAVVPLTTTGDARLPRLPNPGRGAVGATLDAGARVDIVQPFREPVRPKVLFASGTNGDPSLAYNGRIVTWATTSGSSPGHAPDSQVVVSLLGRVQPLVTDPTGTSQDPATDRFGSVVAWDSTGDLAGTGNAGARQVFVADTFGGPVQQASRGVGTSRHATVGVRAFQLAFDSTSDPDTGADTGRSQIWVARNGLEAEPITHGAGNSARPVLSDDGRIIVFESRAALATDGHDTGVSQIFAYDLVADRFWRITSDLGGCSGASVAHIKRDWRITYRCGTEVYFSQLHANSRWRVPTGGDTTGIQPMTDTHFLFVSTTADLVNGGTTPNHGVYLVNLYKHVPVRVPSNIVSFTTP